jgi:hypothetical protein
MLIAEKSLLDPDLLFQSSHKVDFAHLLYEKVNFSLAKGSYDFDF